MCERDRIKRKAERDPALWPRYKQLRNRVTSQLKNVSKFPLAIMEEVNKNRPRRLIHDAYIKNTDYIKRMEHIYM